VTRARGRRQRWAQARRGHAGKGLSWISGRGDFRADGFVATGAGFAQGFEGLRGGEQRRGIDFGDGAATREGHEMAAAEMVSGISGDGQDIKVSESKRNDAWTLPPSFSMGARTASRRVLRVLHQTGPGFLGVADLMTE